MHTVPQGSTCVLSTLTVPHMHTVPQGSTCVLSTLTVSNMHTVPQGSPCALTALRVPQGSSSILSHVWLKGFKTNDTQFQKYCHEKWSPSTCHFWWYLFFNANVDHMLKLSNPPSLAAMYWSQNSNDHSQRPHSAHVCRYCDLTHWVAKYVSQTVCLCHVFGWNASRTFYPV